MKGKCIMKLKAQIIAECDAANTLRLKHSRAAKAAVNDGEKDKAQYWDAYYTGMQQALIWVLESRTDNKHCV